jgi:hypothetical protein
MRVLVAALALLVAGSVAAQDKKPPAPKGEEVTGKVALDGTALTGAVITFHAKDGKTTFSAAIEEGTYKASVPVGEYVVTLATAPAPKDKDQKPPPKILPVVPAKYGDPKTSGITAKIKEGKNTVDLDLKSK